MDISVTFLDHMGSDLKVANAARVSMGRQSSWDIREDSEGIHQALREEDVRLLNYLAREHHFAPFTHSFLSFHVKAPVFVARQLVKHQVGFGQWWEADDYEDNLAWSEVSRRYVSSDPEFFEPDYWRAKADNVKQGSSLVEINNPVAATNELRYTKVLTSYSYSILSKLNVAPEQARMVLPQSTMTEWYWSGSLMAFIRMIRLRMESHAQLECQEVAKLVAKDVARLFPVSYEALIA